MWTRNGVNKNSPSSIFCAAPRVLLMFRKSFFLTLLFPFPIFTGSQRCISPIKSTHLIWIRDSLYAIWIATTLSQAWSVSPFWAGKNKLMHGKWCNSIHPESIHQQSQPQHSLETDPSPFPLSIPLPLSFSLLPLSTPALVDVVFGCFPLLGCFFLSPARVWDLYCLCMCICLCI